VILRSTQLKIDSPHPTRLSNLQPSVPHERLRPFERFRSSIRLRAIGSSRTLCQAKRRKMKIRGETVQVVAGVDLGGTAINYTLVNREEQFLIEALCEHPALSKQGPEICLQQIADVMAAPAEPRTPNMHERKESLLESADGSMATVATRRENKILFNEAMKNRLDSDRPSHGRPFHQLRFCRFACHSCSSCSGRRTMLRTRVSHAPKLRKFVRASVRLKVPFGPPRTSSASWLS
jgi:hypothetical protein